MPEVGGKKLTVHMHSGVRALHPGYGLKREQAWEVESYTLNLRTRCLSCVHEHSDIFTGTMSSGFSDPRCKVMWERRLMNFDEFTKLAYAP